MHKPWQSTPFSTPVSEPMDRWIYGELWISPFVVMILYNLLGRSMFAPFTKLMYKTECMWSRQQKTFNFLTLTLIYSWRSKILDDPVSFNYVCRRRTPFLRSRGMRVFTDLLNVRRDWRTSYPLPTPSLDWVSSLWMDLSQQTYED